MAPTVAITKCASYGEEEVYRAAGDAVERLGGMEKFVKRGERILLKPNLLGPKPREAAVTTDPSVVGAMIRLVKEAGGVPVVGDSAALGSALKAAEMCGVAEACRRHGSELIELTDPVAVESPSGHTFKRFEVARAALEADGIINLPKLKTHAQMFLTLGVKNTFGCVPGKLKSQWHFSAGVDTSMFAGMLLDLHLFLKPRLSLVDGIVAMEGNGPGNGDPRKLGLVFASDNAIAMDTVIAAVLGARPGDVPILKRARETGLGETDIEAIELLGEMETVDGFRFPPLVDVNFASRLPYFIDRRVRKAVTARPHIDVDICTLCSSCVETCPAGVMEKRDRIVIDYDRCIRCYCCQEVCPEGAISVKQGWLKKIVPGL
ncbi:MAG: DUF362 domain-containing protein [Thermodesulfobacteriota bacterium]